MTQKIYERARGIMHPVNRNSIALLFHNGLHNCLFILPIIYLYYHDVIGLSFRDFLICEVFFSAVIVVMEVPSGWLSDVWKRKYVLMLGSAAEALGFSLLLFADSFTDALIAEGFIGIGVSLVSGTNTSILYDTLLQYKKTRHYRRLEGLRHGMGFYIVAGASLIGAMLYAVDPHLPMALTASMYIIAMAVTLVLVEPARETKVMQKNPLHDIVQTMQYTLRGHPEVGALLLFTGVLFGTTQAGFWLQQPYWQAQGVAEMWFGVLAFIGFILAGFAGHQGHRLERLPRRYVMPALILGVAASYIVAGLTGGGLGIALLYMSSMAFGFGMPMIQDALNRRVGSERRATISSAASLCGRLFFLPVGLVTAYVSAHMEIGDVALGLGIFLSLAGLAVLTFMGRQGMLKKAESARAT